MIAILGAKMYAAGDTIPIEESGIDADFRPDQVPVTWRSDVAGDVVGDEAGEGVDDDAGDVAGDEVGDVAANPDAASEATDIQGAEATVSFDDGRVVKERLPRSYRHPALDERLRTERTRSEARLVHDARTQGVPTPVLRDVDPTEARIVFQHVGNRELRGAVTEERVRDVGRYLARIHDAGFVHGDPTTRNVRVGRREAPPTARAGGEQSEATREPGENGDRTYPIDFGLGYFTRDEEDHAMDLHVFAQSLTGTADDPEPLVAAAEDAYRAESERADAVLDRLREVEGRGRYQ
jgi:N6-L-threonylcarbamoyladenine synthase/protein kinase Bud32